MNQYDLYDIAAIYTIIRADPDGPDNQQVLSTLCKILSNEENYRYVNALRMELATIENLDSESFYFAFVENVYTYFSGFLKDERIFSTLLEATKNLLTATRESQEKTVVLADVLHNLPIDIANNNFQIPDTFWEREVSYYRKNWDKDFLVEQEALFLKRKSFWKRKKNRIS